MIKKDDNLPQLGLPDPNRLAQVADAPWDEWDDQLLMIDDDVGEYDDGEEEEDSE